MCSIKTLTYKGLLGKENFYNHNIFTLEKQNLLLKHIFILLKVISLVLSNQNLIIEITVIGNTC